MKLIPLKEILAKSQEKIDEALAPVRARQVKAKAELEKAQLESDLITLERDIHELTAKKDIDFPKLFDKLDEVALLERRMQQYDEVLSQLFPEAA